MKPVIGADPGVIERAGRIMNLYINEAEDWNDDEGDEDEEGLIQLG